MKLSNKIILVLMINFLSLFFVSVVSACDKDEAIDLGDGWCKYYNCGNIHGPGGKSIPRPSCNNSSSYSCGVGTAISKKRSGYTYTWKCENWFKGVSAGTTDKCSYTPPPPSCSGFGGCGNGSASGQYLGSESSYQQPYNWTCAGDGGSISCSYPIVHGKCNANINQAAVSFDPQTGSYNPNADNGMCSSGTFVSGLWSSGTAAGSKYNYSCHGSPGGWGRVDSCSWTPSPVAGMCGGPFNGQIINKDIPLNQQSNWNNFCSSGPKSLITTTQSSNNWNCLGTYGGNNAQCNVTVQPSIGQCNDLFAAGNTTAVSVLPINELLCKRGNLKGLRPSLDLVTKLWTWICAGSGGYEDSGTCSVKHSTSPTDIITPPSKAAIQELKVSGRITPNIVNKGKYCTLTDLNYTVFPANAPDEFVVCTVYKGKIHENNIYPDKDSTPNNGHQVEPGYEYYYSCKTTPPAKPITASPVVLKCVLNPTIQER